MTTFTIDAQNNIARHDSGSPIPEGSPAFSTEAELATLAESWPATRLVHIWNALPGVQPVRKFTNRKTAVRRIWSALHAGTPAAAPVGKPRIPAKRSPAPKPKSTTAKRATTKTEKVIALLRRPEGATLKALMTATCWLPHSVRGFISAQLSKRMGLRVKSYTRDGERVYRIRS
jgi:hypothetical protein